MPRKAAKGVIAKKLGTELARRILRVLDTEGIQSRAEAELRDLWRQAPDYAKRGARIVLVRRFGAKSKVVRLVDGL